MLIPPKKRFRKVVIPPPDKAITQRAVIVSMLTGGIKIFNPSLCGDCISAMECVRALGCQTKILHDHVEISAPPKAIFTQSRALKTPKKITELAKNSNLEGIIALNAGNSATTARLMMGLVAGLGVDARITGDASLRRRSMKHTVKSLAKMGAKLVPTRQKCPVVNFSAPLKGIEIELPAQSAQLKSALILAALNANGSTTINEVKKTRDHTEIMLKNLGFDVKTEENIVKIAPNVRKTSVDDAIVRVPGDISSAAFLIAAALLCENGYAFIKEVGINPLRMGMVNVLIEAGADIKIERLPSFDGEPVGNITVHGSKMRGFEVDPLADHSLIDEIPILAVIACFCNGKSVFKNLSAIKNKESNRMREVAKYLKKFGALAVLEEDTLTIDGNGLRNSPPFVPNDDQNITYSGSNMTESGNIFPNIDNNNVDSGINLVNTVINSASNDTNEVVANRASYASSADCGLAHTTVKCGGSPVNQAISDDKNWQNPSTSSEFTGNFGIISGFRGSGKNAVIYGNIGATEAAESGKSGKNSENISPKNTKTVKKPKKKSTKRVTIKAKDHRIIMAFSVAAMLTDGCVVELPHHVSTSYPEFFSALLD